MEGNALYKKIFRRFSTSLIKEHPGMTVDEHYNEAHVMAFKEMRRLGYVFATALNRWMKADKVQAETDEFWKAFEIATDYSANSKDKAQAKEKLRSYLNIN